MNDIESERMLIVVDTDGWAHIETVQGARDHFEIIDVWDDEYSACDEAGRVYKFEIIPQREGQRMPTFKVVPTSEVDPDLPKRYLHKFAERLGIPESVVADMVRNSQSIIHVFKELEARY